MSVVVRALQKRPALVLGVEDAATGHVLAFRFGRRTHATFQRLLAVLHTTGWQVEALVYRYLAGL